MNKTTNLHYIVRGHSNYKDGELDYSKPFYYVIKNLSEINNIEAEENTSYYLSNYRTTDKLTSYTTTLPKLSKRAFYFLELEQHKGSIQQNTPLTHEEIELLKMKHNRVMPKELQTSNALMCYSTGGGVNLVFMADMKANSSTRKFKKARQKLNLIIKNNAFSSDNLDGFYDESYHFSVRGKILRLPVNNSVNPKYGNVFTGIEINENATPVNLATIDFSKGLDDTTVLKDDIDMVIEDIFTSVKNTMISENERKFIDEDLDYLEELGYLIGQDNRCIHPDHLDLTPSMYVNENGTAYCKAGTNHEDHRHFNIIELVKAKGGDVSRLKSIYQSNINFTAGGDLLTNAVLEITLRHIDRDRVMYVGDRIENNTRCYNFDRNSWRRAETKDIVYIARKILAEVIQRVLIKVHQQFTKEQLKDSVLYKLLLKKQYVVINQYHTELTQALIMSLNTSEFSRISYKALHAVLPPEAEEIIPFENGVYEALTGKFRKEVPTDRVLSRLSVNYRKYNDFNDIEALLDDWTGGEGKELANALARALVRNTSGKMVFLIGEGANGKTTLTSDIMAKILTSTHGVFDRASFIGISDLLDNSANNFMIQDLAHKSVNFSGEIEHFHAQLDGLKNKTASGDTMTVNIKHKEPFKIRFEATLILSGNAMPYVSINDYALMRRMQVFEFPNNYIKTKTAEEIKAFNKMIKSKEFLQKFASYLAQVRYETLKNGEIEQSIEKVVERIKNYNDILATLIKNEYENSPTGAMFLTTIKEDLQKYANKYRQGHQWKINSIASNLEEKGYKVDRTNGVVQGLQRKTSNTPEPPKPTKKQEKVEEVEKVEEKQQDTSVFTRIFDTVIEAKTNELPESLPTVNITKDVTVADDKVLNTVKAILGDVKTGRERVALDIETTGLVAHNSKVALIQIKENDYSEPYILDPKKMFKTQITKHLKKVLSGKAVIGHNLAFDFSFLKEHYGIDPIKDDILILDTMTASRLHRNAISIADELLNNPSMNLKDDYLKTQTGYKKKFNLKVTLKYYLNIEMDKEQQKSDWSGALTEEQIEYALNDVRYLHTLYSTIERKIHEIGMDLVLNLEEQTASAILDANAHTLTIDTQRANALIKTYGEIVDGYIQKYNEVMKSLVINKWGTEEYLLNNFLKYKAEATGKPMPNYTPAKIIKTISGWTDKNGLYISKSKGVFKYVVKETLGIDLKKTDKSAIKKVAKKHEIFSLIEKMTKEIKKYEDLKRTVYNRTEDGRIISKINQIGTITGRMSSSAISDAKTKSGINLQQINSDSDVRELFTAPEGKKLILADYSGMELRIVANIANETTMLNAFRDNEDLHTKTASILFNKDYNEFMEILSDHNHPSYKEYKALRSKAKSMNFLITYGGGAKALSDGAGVSEEEAKELLENYKTKVYPMLSNYITQQNNKSKASSHLGRIMDTTVVLTAEEYERLAEDSKKSYLVRDAVQKGGVYEKPQYTNPVNYPIQSTGVDIVKLALVMLINDADYTKDGVHISHIVHDEIILEVAEELADKWTTKLQKIMETAGNVVMDNKVYMEAEAHNGNNWAEAK